jgi:signal transduction histidine kinase
MSSRTVAVVALAGAAATVLASLQLGGSALEALELAGAAGGGAAAVGLIGAALLNGARRRSLAVQSAILALTLIGAVAAGAMAGSHLMLEAAHPIAALGVILISAGTIGILISFVLGSRVRLASERLIAATRQIGRGDLSTAVEHPGVEEFARLAHELESMQSQLRRSRLREREAEAARRELVAWMSHDLRTPIGRIKAIVEALEDGIVTSPTETAEYYARLQKEADRVGGLVNDLLELNRINAGALSLEPQRVNLHELLSESVASFNVIAESRNVTLNGPERGNADVRVSVTHFERAVANLLDNALRYTHPGGVVDVHVRNGGKRLAVVIEDSCGGVDVDELRRFLVGRNGTGRHGLGLPIANGLVEAQGGSLSVERTNRGCRFALTLPNE